MNARSRSVTLTPPEEEVTAPGVPASTRPDPLEAEAFINSKPLGEDVEKIFYKAQLGAALNLRELAVALGYSYPIMRKWRRDGMPMMDGKITRAEAWTWRKTLLAKKL